VGKGGNKIDTSKGGEGENKVNVEEFGGRMARAGVGGRQTAKIGGKV